MGGVVGAVTGKFIMAGMALCLPMSVNRHRVNAAFDPGAATSSIDRHYASAKTTRIGVAAESFDVAAGDLQVADRIESACGPVDISIGKDVIAAHLWEIDLSRRRLRLVLPYELSSIEKRFRFEPMSEADASILSSHHSGRILLDAANHRIGVSGETPAG